MTQWYPHDELGPQTDPPGSPGVATGENPGYLPGHSFAAGPDGDGYWTGTADQPGGWPDDLDDGQWRPAGPAADTASYPAPPGRPGRSRARPGRRRHPALLAAAAALLIAGVAVTALTARTPARPGSRAAAAASAAPAARASVRSSASRAAPAVAPAVTRSAAEQVLARYIAANNTVNQTRSDAELAQIEGGSSYQLDAGGYQFLSASDPANTGYQPFSFTAAAYYLPRLTGYPRWFAVYGTWDGTRSAPFRAYLIFAQAAPGARWLEVLEPNVTAGTTAVPATGPGGYATAVSAGSAAGLAAAPGSLPAATAARLDGTPAAVTVTGAETLGDQRDQAFWAARVPRGVSDTDQHSPAPYGVYALRTQDGGALVFYSLAAVLTLTPPPGEPMTLQIPGYYSPGTPLTTAATVPYADQFAAVIGPRGSLASAGVIAQNSGIAVKN